ncbi:MAG: hypothetical protein J6Y92_04425, partial [Lentisphaeria bacterium]|nr:hypothetical protein [Lentisphaeria bacterium]
GTGSARLSLTSRRSATGSTATGAAAISTGIAAACRAAGTLSLSKSYTARKGERQESNRQFVHCFVPFKNVFGLFFVCFILVRDVITE